MKAPLGPIVAFGLVAGASLLLGSLEHSWAGWRPASCMPDRCFCEEVRPGGVAQRANTWSSLGFVLVGLLVAGARPASGSGPMDGRPTRAHRAHDAVYAFALVAVGLGSMFFHASLTFVGQCVDVMGMYLLATFIVLHNLSRIRTVSPRAFAASYAASNLVLAWMVVERPALRRYAFGALLVAAWATERIARRSGRRDLVRAAVLTILVAFALWVLDITRVACDPGSWLQGHALWHLLAAVAAGLLHLDHRRERRLGEPRA